MTLPIDIPRSMLDHMNSTEDAAWLKRLPDLIAEGKLGKGGISGIGS